MRKLVVVLVVLAVVLVPLLILAAWAVGTYNRIVPANEQVRSAWGDVENNYQRRMDLIPNLVETVKGVAEFERGTFTEVAEARSRAGQVRLSPELLNDPNAFQAFERTQGELSSALSRLLVTVEQYPQLKANENFRDLQTQLEGTENRIAVSRRRFNETVQGYNVLVQRFPGRIVASMFGFAPRPYFEAREGAEQAPAVKF
ncbi:MAG: LemA family protein [Acidobacteria bacterium]|nr:LemA family protein [Acidobacteriota bacterium]